MIKFKCPSFSASSHTGLLTFSKCVLFLLQRNRSCSFWKQFIPSLYIGQDTVDKTVHLGEILGTTNNNYLVKLVVTAGAKFLQVVCSVWTVFVIIDRSHASFKRIAQNVVKKIINLLSKTMFKKSDFCKCANSNVDPRMDSFCNNWSMPCFVFHPLHSTTSNHRKALRHCDNFCSKIAEILKFTVYILPTDRSDYGRLW